MRINYPVRVTLLKTIAVLFYTILQWENMQMLKRAYFIQLYI